MRRAWLELAGSLPALAALTLCSAHAFAQAQERPVLAAADPPAQTAPVRSTRAKEAKPLAAILNLPPAPIVIAPAPASPSPSAQSESPVNTCKGEDVEALVRRLSEWHARFKANERVAYVERHCVEPGVVCFNRFGDAELDSLPESAHPGQLFTAEVIVPVVDRGRFAVTTSIRGKTAVGAGPFDKEPAAPPSPTASNAAPPEACELAAHQRDALRKAAAPIADLAAQRGMEALDAPEGSSSSAYWSPTSHGNPFSEWSAWATAHAASVPRFTALESTIEVPANEQTVNIDFTRTEKGEDSPSAEHHREVRIDHGHYYVEASLLVPFVVLGERKATLTPTPSGTELRVGLEQDWHVTGALMVDFFPFGRQKGQLSSFDHCRSRSCVENWLGVQVGMGLSSPLEEWYLGLELQPVSGLAIGVGAAMLHGQFLGPGMAEGMLLPSASSFTYSTDYMFRPYFGLALTTDILETIDHSGIFNKLQ